MKEKNPDTSLIVKQILLLIIIYLALQVSVTIWIYIAEKTFPFTPDSNDVSAFLLLFLAPVLLVPTYIFFNLLTLIPYLKSVKYNFKYVFSSIFIGSLLFSISYFTPNYETITVIIQIVAFLLFFGLAWMFKKFDKSKKIPEINRNNKEKRKINE